MQVQRHTHTYVYLPAYRKFHLAIDKLSSEKKWNEDSKFSKNLVQLNNMTHDVTLASQNSAHLDTAPTSLT